jgi:hypothetical protein
MRSRVHSDEGASLLIVLVFMILIAVLTLAMLDFTGAAFQPTDAVRTARQATYSAEDAIELAIRKVADDPTGTLGASGSALPCSFTLAGANDIPTTTVTCQPDGNAGGLDPSFARNAILTLDGTGTGLKNDASNLKLNGNFDYYINGSVFSNSGIDKANNANTITASTITGVKSVNSPNGVKDSCKEPNLVATPSTDKYCGLTEPNPDSTAGLDPGWVPNVTAVPATAPTPTCSGSSTRPVQVFSPGSYTTAPSALTTGNCSSSTAIWYFTSGNYYFSSLTSLNFATGLHDVVAGTASSWYANPSSPAAVPTDGTACDPAAAGAQFIFGGAAQLTVDNRTTTFTICAPTSIVSTQPKIAMYGVGSAVAGLAATLLPATTFAVVTNDAPNVFVQGAVYFPKNNVSIALHQRGSTVFSGGIAAYRITLNISASTTQAQSPFTVPTCVGVCRTKRRVLFIAKSGSKQIRVVVQFNETTAPTHNYSIDSWTVLP